MHLKPTRVLLLAVALRGVTFAIPAPAQEAPEAPAAVESAEETLWTLIQKGGWLMWPIGICSIVALTVTFERLVSLRRSRTTPPGLLEEVFRRLSSWRASREARESCAAMLADDGSVLANVLRSGVLRLQRGPKVVATHLQETTAKEMHVLKRRVRPLAVVSSVAPLLGLLGTIYGMIVCFERAGAADSASRTETLASGIYEALVTTATGLTIAIPALLLHHYFLGRIDRIIDQVEEAASEFLERSFAEEDAGPEGTPARGRSGQSAAPQAVPAYPEV